jgi:Type II secretion system (T2SS), protein M subtype b
MTPLRPRSMASRALALGLMGLLVAVVWLGAVDSIRRRYDENDHAIADGIGLLAGLKSVIVQGRQVGAERSASDLERYRGDFLAGPEDAIIVADLQTRLRSLITARNAELSSARALQPKSRDGLEYLGLALQIRAEMKSIQEVLHAIETGTPLLFVERVDLRLDERGAAAARARNAESVAPMTLRSRSMAQSGRASHRHRGVRKRNDPSAGPDAGADRDRCHDRVGGRLGARPLADADCARRRCYASSGCASAARDCRSYTARAFNVFSIACSSALF